MIAFANLFLSEYACTACSNKTAMRITNKFSTINYFGALKAEDRLLKTIVRPCCLYGRVGASAEIELDLFF